MEGAWVVSVGWWRKKGRKKSLEWREICRVVGGGGEGGLEGMRVSDEGGIVVGT